MGAPFIKCNDMSCEFRAFRGFEYAVCPGCMTPFKKEIAVAEPFEHVKIVLRNLAWINAATGTSIWVEKAWSEILDAEVKLKKDIPTDQTTTIPAQEVIIARLHHLESQLNEHANLIAKLSQFANKYHEVRNRGIAEEPKTVFGPARAPGFKPVGDLPKLLPHEVDPNTRTRFHYVKICLHELLRPNTKSEKMVDMIEKAIKELDDAQEAPKCSCGSPLPTRCGACLASGIFQNANGDL